MKQSLAPSLGSPFFDNFSHITNKVKRKSREFKKKSDKPPPAISIEHIRPYSCGCRSPPPSFLFAYQPTNRNGGFYETNQFAGTVSQCL